jgi:2-polyprenyl-3-methyl-5-hydroxy-6-metoxy-1,4-benzoquinol methylase
MQVTQSPTGGYQHKEYEEAVLKIYSLLESELAETAYQPWEVDLINSPHLYYGDYLNPKSRSYTIGRLVHNISRSLEHLAIPANGAPYRILDVGCGLGQQSLLYALYGAQVVGIDLNPKAIDLATRRKPFYEAKFGRPLDVSYLPGDFNQVATTLAPESFDAVFSMSAFIHIPPLSKTVATIARLLRPGGRVVIWDLNSTYPVYQIRGGYQKGLPTPSQVCDAFSEHDFSIDLLTGGASIPNAVWVDSLEPLLNRVSNFISKHSLRLSYNFFLSGRKALPNASRR